MRKLKVFLWTTLLVLTSWVVLPPSLQADVVRIALYLTNNTYLTTSTTAGVSQDLIGINNGDDVAIGWPNSHVLQFKRGGGEQWRIDGSAHFKYSNNPGKINALTNDAADSFAACLAGGGDCPDNTRGGWFEAYGNEHATFGGAVDIQGGAVSTGNVKLQINQASAQIQFLRSTGNAAWYFDNTGFLQQTSSGADIIFSKANGVALYYRNGITAAGTSRTDCFNLVGAVNQVGTVAAGTGVCLWSPNAAGILVVVQNIGANDLKLYPSSGAGSINGITAGNPITLASATKQMAMCYHAGSNNWICNVATSPVA